MHWTIGKRRPHDGTAEEAARSSAKATRIAATIGLIGALLSIGGAAVVESVDHDSASRANCTAAALSDFMYLYDDGVISHAEYEDLRADAIDDELSDIAECP